jgi:hypothetical protein
MTSSSRFGLNAKFLLQPTQWEACLKHCPAVPPFFLFFNLLPFSLSFFSFDFHSFLFLFFPFLLFPFLSFPFFVFFIFFFFPSLSLSSFVYSLNASLEKMGDF